MTATKAVKPASATKGDAIRRAQLGLIHQAKTALGMDDGAYRAMLAAQAGVTSAADLDAPGRAKVIDYLREQGFKPPERPANARRREAAPAAGKVGLWKKIDALLFSMGKTRSYLDGEIKTRIAGGIAAWEFADAKILSKVIAALQMSVKRKDKKNDSAI